VLSVGNLEAERDFLDVRDVVAAYVAAIHRRESLPAGEAVNLATAAPVRIAAIVDLLVAAAGRPVEVRPDPARLRPSEIPRASGSRARAQSLLGWRPRIALQTTVHDVLEHWRRMPPD
jgi:GDP-4-dehydro-6-deoxy-D-mannose reductase